MSEPIKVGDLVVVTGVHCKPSLIYGRFLTVNCLFHSNWLCVDCLKASLPEPCANFAEISGYYACPVCFLKRIPPLSELEGEKRDEEITA